MGRYFELNSLVFSKGDGLGNYVIEDKLGSGNFGSVFKALETTSNQYEAVKVCKLGADADDVNRFNQENSILHKLKTNKRIIFPITDILKKDPYIYYSMELADSNLEKYLNTHSGLDFKNKIELFSGIVEGMKFAHDQGVVHRDLWWNNVLLKNDPAHGKDNPKITDFGRAKDFGEISLTQVPQEVWGIHCVKPPEAHLKVFDTAAQSEYVLSDIYALGILLFYILESTPSYYAISIRDSIKKFIDSKSITLASLTSQQRLQAYQQWLSETDFSRVMGQLNITIADKKLNDSLNSMIQKLCNPDYSKRYQTVDQLMADLAQLS